MSNRLTLWLLMLFLFTSCGTNSTQETKPTDYSITLDVNETTHTSNWLADSAASDNNSLSASIATDGSYGACTIDGYELKYTKTVDNNKTDACVLNITDSTDLFTITVTIDTLFWRQADASRSHSAAIKSDGTLWSWGSNVYGQLGDGTTVSRSAPVQVGTDTTWQSVSVGHAHTKAIKSDGSLYSWGSNHFGQLGIPGSGNKNTPVKIGLGTTWRSVSTGSNFTSVISSDGTLWFFGWHWYYDFSIGRVPTQVSADTNWQSVSESFLSTHALKSDGTIWVWRGANASLKLVQQGTDTDWQSVSAGRAIKNDGTLWFFEPDPIGFDYDSNYSADIPIQIGTDTDWQSVSGGRLALKNNGTLWGWGDNSFGQLGDGTTVDKGTPVQIDSNTTWQSVSAGANYTLAIKSDGSLWSWGDNRHGQLGDDTNISKSTPVQILGRLGKDKAK